MEDIKIYVFYLNFYIISDIYLKYRILQLPLLSSFIIDIYITVEKGLPIGQAYMSYE